MGDHVWSLVGAATMRRLDRHTIEDLGVPGALLMECAGQAVLREVLALREPGSTVWIACGGGNNGGDGLVVARHLHLRGVPVRLWCSVDPARLQGDAAANWQRAQAVGVPISRAGLRPEPGSVVVDALFGTGLAREVDGAAADAIRKINLSRPACQVVSVDLPSGLCADTGQVLGAAVRADCTVTLGLPKLGLALEPGRSRAGRVVVARIGIADEAPGVRPDAELWTLAAAGAQLPARPADGHKGTFGHALIVAGSEGKTGAAALAAAGAARTGAGLVTIACPQSANAVLEMKCTEAMTAPVPETADHTIAAEAEKAILDLAQSRDAVVLGPGLGRADETLGLVRQLMERIDQPVVLDADGLIAFADSANKLGSRLGPTIMTPHPGEAAALLACSGEEINRDRPAAARRLAEESGAVVVLKGAATVIADPVGRVVVNPCGGPNLATGGTGDVLAGMIGGLLCQGASAFEAAALGAIVHGLAADRIAERTGGGGMLAGELAAELPPAFQALRDAADAAGPDPLGVGDAVAFPEPD